MEEIHCTLEARECAEQQHDDSSTKIENHSYQSATSYLTYNFPVLLTGDEPITFCYKRLMKDCLHNCTG